jgi:hypothetical protein
VAPGGERVKRSRQRVKQRCDARSLSGRQSPRFVNEQRLPYALLVGLE